MQHKDVDGLHPLNVAQLANTKTHAPGRSAWSFDNIDFHVSCTPQVTLLHTHLCKCCVIIFVLSHSIIAMNFIVIFVILGFTKIFRDALSCWTAVVWQSRAKKQ